MMANYILLIALNVTEQLRLGLRSLFAKHWLRGTAKNVLSTIEKQKFPKIAAENGYPIVQNAALSKNILDPLTQEIVKKRVGYALNVGILLSLHQWVTKNGYTTNSGNQQTAEALLGTLRLKTLLGVMKVNAPSLVGR